MIKKRFLLPVLIFCVFFVFGRAQAIMAPQIYLENLTIDGSSYKAGAAISGNVTVHNYDSTYAGDLMLQYQLLTKEVDGVPTQAIDQRMSTEKFELAAGAQVAKNVKYTLPVNLPNGNSVFRVLLVNSRGEEISWDDKVISVGGEGNFLTIDTASIVKDGKEMASGGGVYYDPGQAPSIRFNITNDSGFTISAFPRMTTYIRNPGTNIANKVDQEAVVLEVGAKKTVDYTLGKLTDPETYVTEVKLYDNKTKLPVSNSVYFRWIISGPGAKVLFVETDKDTYKAGETAQVTVLYNGPADYELNGGKATIQSQIVDNGGKVVGQTSQEIVLTPGKVTLNVPVQSDVNGFNVASSISDGSNKLDQYAMKISPNEKVASVSQPLTQDQTQKSVWEDNRMAIIIGIIILLAGAAIIYFIKRK